MGQCAGLSHAQILAMMGDLQRSATVAGVRDTFLKGAQQRQSLDDVMTESPRLLAPFEAGLLRLGETGGQLERVLKFLADYFGAEFRAVQRIKRLLGPPMISGIAATFIVAFPVLYFGNATGYFITVGLELAGLFLVGGVVLTSVARSYRNRPEFVVGRFCRALAMGVEAGLPLAQVTEFAVAAADHRELTRHLDRIPRRERDRQPLAKTFAGCPALPFEVIAALEVADATGNYSDTVVKLAKMYDRY